jgi:hypothetical protein
MRMALATVAASAVLVVIPTAVAAPASDGQGYLNSTARCSPQDNVAVFGSTDASRVAVCKTAGGHYEYRGVRLSDGARLIVAADATDDGAFVAHNSKISYLVTAKSLVVSDGKTVIREEPMVDFHRPQAPAPQAPAPAPEKPAAPEKPPPPLPPPLPAERGGGPG